MSSFAFRAFAFSVLAQLFYSGRFRETTVECHFRYDSSAQFRREL